MRLLMIGCVIGTGIFGFEPRAFAQADTPSFMMMDVDGARSQLEVDAGFTFPTGDDLGGVMLAPRLRVQALVTRGFGLYGALRAATLFDDRSNEAAASNLELGAIAHTRLGPNADLSVHAGLVPGLWDGDPTVSLSSILSWPSDFATSLGHTWLRGGVSAGYHGGGAAFRIDAGVDQDLGGDGGLDTLLHLNAGIAIRNAAWSATAELQVLIPLGDAQPDAMQALGISLRHHGAEATPYVGLTAPIGNAITVHTLTLSAGVAVAL